MFLSSLSPLSLEESFDKVNTDNPQVKAFGEAAATLAAID
jgi:hypothetical protein